MSSHYNTGEDYLDHERKKKKFSYKKEKAKLDSRMSNYHKEMESLKQERLEKDARKKALEKAKKAAAEADKKRSNYKIRETKAVSTTKKAVPLPTSKAVKLKHKAVKKK